MTTQDLHELAALIEAFVESSTPTSASYGRPTIDETIEQEPYYVLQRFASWLRDTEVENETKH